MLIATYTASNYPINFYLGPLPDEAWYTSKQVNFSLSEDEGYCGGCSCSNCYLVTESLCNHITVLKCFRKLYPSIADNHPEYFV